MMSRIWNNMKEAIFHPKAKELLRTFSKDVRQAIGQAILELQKGNSLFLPLSKPMPTVGLGVEELRVKDSSNLYRIFYYKKCAKGILVFHAFVKKTQKTPVHEIKLGRSKLKEMLYEENK